MKKILVMLSCCFLFACVDAQKEDLAAFVIDTKSKVYPLNDEVPTLKDITALEFTQLSSRNPFSTPKAEILAPTKPVAESCPQPNVERKKQALEMHALENIEMRGTLLVDNELWALMLLSSGEVHKIKQGYYLGLHYGKVVKVSKSEVDLLELILDSNGCWQERETKITLAL